MDSLLPIDIVYIPSQDKRTESSRFPPRARLFRRYDRRASRCEDSSNIRRSGSETHIRRSCVLCDSIDSHDRIDCEHFSCHFSLSLSRERKRGRENRALSCFDNVTSVFFPNVEEIGKDHREMAIISARFRPDNPSRS